jgi:hypothetical protein
MLKYVYLGQVVVDDFLVVVYVVWAFLSTTYTPLVHRMQPTLRT